MGLVVAVAVVCTLAGCTERTAPDGDPIATTTLAMGSAGGWERDTIAALSTSPIHLGAFSSWYGGDEEFDEVTGEAPDGSAYLVVTGRTGCRVPDGLAVSRKGSDLAVLFVGGTDHETCVQEVRPGAYVAVPADAVDGVRTVNGEALVSPAGPGELIDNVPLGAGAFDPVLPAERGTPELEDLRAGVLAARPEHAEAVTAALATQVPAGKRGFVFVVTGCVVDDVVLMVGPDGITAEPVEPEVPVNCDAPEYFLATFTIDADDVPKGITLTD